jgi:hypothetical protein
MEPLSYSVGIAIIFAAVSTTISTLRQLTKSYRNQKSENTEIVIEFDGKKLKAKDLSKEEVTKVIKEILNEHQVQE